MVLCISVVNNNMERERMETEDYLFIYLFAARDES